jgi:branched-subunit amino acid ABC-type transport system permease component
LRRALLLVLALLCSFAALSGVASAQDTTEHVKGTMRDPDGKPIEGVHITVRDKSGAQLGDDTTAADGTWSIEIPGPGAYSAELDEKTLPKGVALRDSKTNPRDFLVRVQGQDKLLLFLTGQHSKNHVALWKDLLQLSVEGIKFGLVIAMAAVGLSLIFGTTGLVNFAHGEMVTWGALVAWFFNVRLGWNLIPAAIVAIAIGGLTGALQDRILWRPLRRRETGLIAMLVVSIGLSLFLRYVFLFQFGGRTRPFKDYAVQRAWTIGPIDIAPKDLLSIVLCLVVLVGIALGLQRTRMGKAMRAVADNPDLASSSGIDVQRVILLVWFFGSALAALGGILLALTEQASFQMGFQLLLLMFAGVTLGGLGTAYGALVGSLIVGLFIDVSTHWIPTELKNVGALLILIVILVVRPQGILGSKERVG